MALRRFMIESRSIRNGYATFGNELFNHIVRVLRLGCGDELVLVDEQGREHVGVIDQTAKEWVVVKIVGTGTAAGDLGGVGLTLCQALPKGEKTDFILQKGTELGVHDFCLFGGRRSVPRIREDQVDAKLDRWRKIVTEAARQCERRQIPPVAWCPSVVEAAAAATQPLRLLLWEDERERNLKQVLERVERPSSLVVAIGPEGGFDPLEVRHFTENGFQTVSLGDRILRTETAALAIAAIVQYIWS